MPQAGGIDITRLPDDVAALIEALHPGEELLITRDGVPVATISPAGNALQGDIIARDAPQDDTEQSAATHDDVTVVATAAGTTAPLEIEPTRDDPG